MKTFALCITLSVLAFVGMNYQMGVWDAPAPRLEKETPALEKETPKRKISRFPHDLAPTVQAQPVAWASVYTPGPNPQKIAFLKLNGDLHPWQEQLIGYKDEWLAERVEDTALVVVVGLENKRRISVTTYPNAPAVYRHLYELEVSVVEAKTGTVLANRWFQNMPRPVRPIEDWRLTQIGRPVSPRTVLTWVMSQSKLGFPEPTCPHPVVVEVE